MFYLVVPEGTLRLVGLGDGISYGRLEVYYHGEWGTICRDNFGDEEAHVACRQLGFRYVEILL